MLAADAEDGHSEGAASVLISDTVDVSGTAGPSSSAPTPLSPPGRARTRSRIELAVQPESDAGSDRPRSSVVHILAAMGSAGITSSS